jgi:hypothetical protein
VIEEEEQVRERDENCKRRKEMQMKKLDLFFKNLLDLLQKFILKKQIKEILLELI